MPAPMRPHRKVDRIYFLSALVAQEPGQKEHERRYVGDQRERDDHGAEKRHHLAHQVLEGHFCDLDHHEQQQAVRWGHQADHDVDDRDQPEMHGVDAQRLRGGEENRNDDQQDRGPFQKATENQENHVRSQQEGKRRELVPLHHDGERPWNVLDRDDVVEDHRGGDQDADRYRDARAGQQRGVDAAAGDGAIEERGNQQCVEDGERGGFRGRGDPAVKAAEKDHRHHQRGEGLPRDARDVAQRDGLLDREISPLGDERDIGHLRDAEEQARDDAAEEQVADGSVRDQGIDHHRDRRRDDGPDDRGCGGQGGGKARRVFSVLRHHLLHQLARTRGTREGRARHSREDDALYDVDVSEAAAEAPDERVAEVEQPFRDAADGHELGGEDEQRYRQQHEAVVHAVGKLLGGGADIEAGHEKKENRNPDHRVPDREPEQGEGDDLHDAEREEAGGDLKPERAFVQSGA